MVEIPDVESEEDENLIEHLTAYFDRRPCVCGHLVLVSTRWHGIFKCETCWKKELTQEKS